MISELDTFMLESSAQADPVMGTDSMVIGSVILLGVWSGISGSNQSAEGGLQYDVSASVTVNSAAGIDLDLIGKIGTVKGQSLRCINADIGEVFTTVFFEHVSQATAL